MEKSKRQVQKEKTGDKIIKTAFKVYSESGFTTATSTIAKEAGVAHGSIFLHFSTLDDLIDRLLSEFGSTVNAKIENLSDSRGSIEELLDAHIEILAEYEMFYYRLITETVLLPQSAKAVINAIQTNLAVHFGKVFEQGIKDKDIRMLPVPLLFNTWIGLVHYYLQNKEVFAPAGSVLKRYKKQLIFTYCELIRRY